MSHRNTLPGIRAPYVQAETTGKTMPLRTKLLGLTLALVTIAGPTAALAAEGFARSPATLRAGPGAEYPRVASIARGEGLEVYGCLARATWCDVSDGDDRGWMQGNRIEFLRGGRRTRLSGDPSAFGLAILSFGLGDYWGAHYQNRPWVHDRRWSPRAATRPSAPPRYGDYPAGPRIPMPGTDTGDRPMTARPPRPAPVPSVVPRVPRTETRPSAARQERPDAARPPVMQQRPTGGGTAAVAGPAARRPPTAAHAPQGGPPAGKAPAAPCVDPKGCR
jgi:uncharacterized protein YraI